MSRISKYNNAVNKLLAGATVRIPDDTSLLAGLRSQYYRERDKLIAAGYPNTRQFQAKYEDSTSSYLVKLVPIQQIGFAVEVSGEATSPAQNV